MRLFNFFTNDLKSSHSYYREQFYSSHIKLDSFDRLMQLVNNYSVSDYTSGSLICFKDIPWGVSEKEVMRLKGRPRFVKQLNSEKIIHRVLLYKVMLTHRHAIAQLHLVNDALVYASYYIQKIGIDEMNEIKETLRLKYLKEDVNQIAFPTFVIIDEPGNKLIFEGNLFNATIHYMSGNKTHFKMITEGQQQLKNKNVSFKPYKYLNSLFMNL